MQTTLVIFLVLSFVHKWQCGRLFIFLGKQYRYSIIREFDKDGLCDEERDEFGSGFGTAVV